VDLAHLNRANVGGMEFLGGPRRARWGSGAIGGVLSITTKSGQLADNASHVDFSAGVGTQGTLQGSMNARSQSDNVGISAYASYIRTDG
jgi:Outer membrane cobalamin receptor protein